MWCNVSCFRLTDIVLQSPSRKFLSGVRKLMADVWRKSLSAAPNLLSHSPTSIKVLPARTDFIQSPQSPYFKRPLLPGVQSAASVFCSSLRYKPSAANALCRLLDSTKTLAQMNKIKIMCMFIFLLVLNQYGIRRFKAKKTRVYMSS